MKTKVKKEVSEQVLNLLLDTNMSLVDQRKTLSYSYSQITKQIKELEKENLEVITEEE